MKEKPILFSTPMVQATLDNRKTQTRRIAKIPINANVEIRGKKVEYYSPMHNQNIRVIPRYQPGDILYVRETFFCEPCLPDCAGHTDENECIFNRVGDKCYGYKAQYTTGEGDLKIKWKPSIHMPREAARLFLRVTDVGAERLQDITPEDCVAEGVGFRDGRIMKKVDCESVIIRYRALWDSLNSKGGHDWDANPWVFVYEFERIEYPQETRITV